MEILDFCFEKLSKSGIQEFDVYWEKSSQLGLEAQDGKLDHMTQSVEQGLCIRVLKEDKGEQG